MASKDVQCTSDPQDVEHFVELALQRRLHAEMTQGCPYPVFTLPEHPPAVGHCSSKLVNPEKWIGPRYVHWTINGVDPSTAAIIWSHTNLPHFHELQDDSRQVACRSAVWAISFLVD